MNRHSFFVPVFMLQAALLICSFSACSQAGETGAALSQDKAHSFASRIIESSHSSGGICSFIGCKNTALPAAVARQGRFTVHCLCADEKECRMLRRKLQKKGCYGTVSVHVFSPGGLPYMQNLINIVIVDESSDLMQKGLDREEILRVLAPLGSAFFVNTRKETFRRITKPWPGSIDEWGHYLHGPDGNPVAEDATVAPPAHYQWTGDPEWMRSHETDSSISTIVTSRGRLFYIEDQAPISLAGNHPLPDKWFLVARDAFNGVHLWKVPIRRWGWREWKHSWFNTRPGDVPLNIQKRLVAHGDRVYATLGYHAPVTQLDARTGRILQTYRQTGPAGEILYRDGTLILSILKGENVKVASVDAETGEQNWISKRSYSGSTVDYVRWKAMRGSTKPATLDPSLNMATDGETIALIDGANVAALDYKTGREKWSSPFPLVDADLNAGRIKTNGRLWIGTMIVKHGVVIHASPNNLAGFSAETGTVLWTQPKRYIGHLWYEWKDVFVIDGLVWSWGADLERSVLKNSGKRKQKSLYPTTVRGYDIQTGELKKKVELGYIFKTHHHHRCYRNKATPRYILASRRGTEFVDLKEGNHTVHNWVRGTCHVGMMPANGLQYAPAHPCQCYINEKLNGMTVLAPKGSVKGFSARNRNPQLTKGPAFGSIGNGDKAKAGGDDWPTFRANAQRTGSVATTVPSGVSLLWKKKAGIKVSPPVVAGKRLFVSLVDEHQVLCLETSEGGTLWSYTAGARIDSPPTYYRGTVLFGCADGHIYCLRASDGELAWRFRAAPSPRLISAFGQLESPWPVHGSVLVEDGRVYCAAGRTSQLDGGILVYCLEASTGNVRNKTRLQGPDYTVRDLEENYRMPMGALPDILISDGQAIHMHTTSFDKNLDRTNSSAELHVHSSFLDDSYFKRMPWRYNGEYGRLIVHDKRSVYYVRMFDSLRGLDPTVYFTPAGKGYLLFGKTIGKKQKRWMERIPIRIRAMAASSSRLFTAGAPDVMDPNDPLGAFEGRKGGILYIVNTENGETISEHTLSEPPVFNGAAVAGARLYLGLEKGFIACYGRK